MYEKSSDMGVNKCNVVCMEEILESSIFLEIRFFLFLGKFFSSFMAKKYQKN